jgi:hypothetical protein
MSKLSRREFKELLTEWNSNLLSERGKYSYLVKQTKPATIITLNFNQANLLKKFLNESNEIEILQDVSTLNLGFGKVISNDRETKSKLINFFKSKGDKELSRQLTVTDDKEPIIIASSAGDNLGGENLDSDGFYWLLHDIEHLIYGENSILGEYHRGWCQWEGAYDDYSIEIQNVKDGYEEDNILSDREMKGFLNHLALHKFFTEIKFTESVGENDFPASIFAYCISKMDNQKDFSIINNAKTIDNSEKERLRSIFFNAYKPSNDQAQLLINKLENKILVCLDF